MITGSYVHGCSKTRAVSETVGFPAPERAGKGGDDALTEKLQHLRKSVGGSLADEGWDWNAFPENKGNTVGAAMSMYFNTIEYNII